MFISHRSVRICHYQQKISIWVYLKYNDKVATVAAAASAAQATEATAAKPIDAIIYHILIGTEAEENSSFTSFILPFALHVGESLQIPLD